MKAYKFVIPCGFIVMQWQANKIDVFPYALNYNYGIKFELHKNARLLPYKN